MENQLIELRSLLIKGFLDFQTTSIYCQKSKGYHAGWKDAYELAKQIINDEIEKDQ